MRRFNLHEYIFYLFIIKSKWQSYIESENYNFKTDALYYSRYVLAGIYTLNIMIILSFVSVFDQRDYTKILLELGIDHYTLIAIPIIIILLPYLYFRFLSLKKAKMIVNKYNSIDRRTKNILQVLLLVYILSIILVFIYSVTVFRNSFP